MYPDHAADAEGLLRAADVALFRAKGSGATASRSTARPCSMRPRSAGSSSRCARRREGELLLMYQPQVSLHTLESTNVEALLRWRKPDGRVATAPSSSTWPKRPG
jgi:predicted signal transduction protein with EAL and GGDEF domain